MKSRNETEERLAVSETVGFVIIAGIIFMSIGIVFANGFPILEDTQESEHISNTEKTFNTLQGNVDEIVDREVPRRATEIRLFGSTISVGRSTAQLNVSNTTDPDPDEWGYNQRNSEALIYEHEGEQIIYEMGALIRASRDTDSSAMLREPGWVVRESDDLVILPIQRLRGGGSLSGDGSVRVRTSRGSTFNRNLLEETPPFGIGDETEEVEEFTIEITSEYADSWQDYFENLGRGNEDVNAIDTGEENVAQIEFEDDLVEDGKFILKDNEVEVELAQ